MHLHSRLCAEPLRLARLHDRGGDPPAADCHRQASREHPASARRHRVPIRQVEGRRRVSRIAIIGSGAWGTALAISLAKRGSHSIALWSHTASVAETTATPRENRTYRPRHVTLSSIRATADLAQ